MPLVNLPKSARNSRAPALFPRCANPGCATGWIRLWRSRRLPGFEGHWACSPGCMMELVRHAIRREGEAAAPAAYAHRKPLGLMLLEQGRITEEQLRQALEAIRQTRAATGEALQLGDWLVQSGLLSEDALARAVGAQWGSPLVRLDGFRAADSAHILPQFLAEAMTALPVRINGGRSLCLAFGGAVDRSLTWAVERMTDTPVTAAVALDSEFRRAHAAFVGALPSRTRFLEVASPKLLAGTVTKLIESEKPEETRLVRLHSWYWLRWWRRCPEAGISWGDSEDLICTIGAIRDR